MQIPNFIISACSLLFLVSSIHLFYAKQGNHMLNRLLSVVIFTRFCMLTVYLLITSGHQDIFPFFYRIFTPLYYAAPACSYLYVAGFINDRSHFRKSDWFHFIPAILAIIHVIPWHSSVSIDWDAIAKQISENKQVFITKKNGLFPAVFYYLGMPVLLAGYLIAAWYEVLASQILRKKGWETSTQWIFFFLTGATFFKVMGIIPLMLGGLHQPIASWFVIINCIVILCLMLFILHKPELLYGYLIVATNWKINNAEQKIPTQLAGLFSANNLPPQKASEYTATILVPTSPKNNLQTELLSEYTEAMKQYMETEKPFLMPGFQIIHVAQKLEIPIHHCSFVINNVMEKNFRDWINAYRIQEFIIRYPILADKMTIEAIASQSGFKSIATFYNAFKKETGVMPTAYFFKRSELV